MLTKQDLRRLIESTHDLNKTKNASRLTSLPEQVQALAESHKQLSDARARFIQTYKTFRKEVTETNATRARMYASRESLLQQYTYTREQAQHAFFTIHPKKPLDQEEAERRQSLFHAAFGQTRSTLDRSSEDKLQTSMEATVEQIRNENLLNQTLRDELLQEYQTFAKDKAAIDAERDDDKEANQALQKERAALDRFSEAHSLLVQSILVREQKKESQGQFIKRLDPSYQARLRSNTSITIEEETQQLSNDLEEPIEDVVTSTENNPSPTGTTQDS